MYDKITIPTEMQNRVYAKFCKLPLRHKLVVYAKLVHGNSFKPQNNDLFGLNRRLVSSIFRSFIDSLKEKTDVKEDTTTKGKPKAKNGRTNKERT